VCVILVVDEHVIYRTGFRVLIEKNVEQSRVAEAPSVEGIPAGENFDLALVDAGCMKQRPLGVSNLHQANPASRFAITSTSNIRADVLNFLSAGFHGFICKLDSDNEILSAINDLLSGRIYVPRWFAEGHHIGSKSPPSCDILRLPPRQRELLPLLAQGMSNTEIARHLHISEGTTKIHACGLLRALGARNRTEAAFLAATLLSGSSEDKRQSTPPELVPPSRSGWEREPLLRRR
jgi:DNA-binding NarL/FixJ family response regulator